MGWKGCQRSSYSNSPAADRDTLSRLLKVLSSLAWKRPKRQMIEHRFLQNSFPRDFHISRCRSAVTDSGSLWSSVTSQLFPGPPPHSKHIPIPKSTPSCAGTVRSHQSSDLTSQIKKPSLNSMILAPYFRQINLNTKTSKDPKP